MDWPDTITTPATAAAVMAELTALVRRDPASLPPVVRGSAIKLPHTGLAGTANVAPVAVLPDTEPLPVLTAPAGGWGSATPATTAYYASLVATAEFRADWSAELGRDPATLASTARQARKDAAWFQNYAAVATGALEASAAAWWPSVRAAMAPTPTLRANAVRLRT